MCLCVLLQWPYDDKRKKVDSRLGKLWGDVHDGKSLSKFQSMVFFLEV